MKTCKQNPTDFAFLKLLPVISILVVMAFEMPSAMAQDDEDTKFGLSVGVFVANRDTQTRIDGMVGAGTDVDLESELGLDSSDTVFRVDGYYLFNEKHRLDFSLFDLSRSASQQIQRDIEWNDTLFQIDTTINSNFDLSIYKLAYTWSFMRRDKGFLGVTAGVYVADIGMRLSSENTGAREGRALTMPLPVIGLRGQYDFSEKLTFRASGEVFALEYEDFDGSLYDFYAGLDYQFFDRVAIGVGINSVRLDIGINKERFNGELDWRYDGGLLFLKFDF